MIVESDLITMSNREDKEEVVLVIQHSPNVPFGVLGDFFIERGIRYKIIKLYEEKLPPEEHPYRAVVSLGGIMGAYDEDEFPFLIDEKNYLVASTLANRPILGICLGCQLLADALGGKAYRAPKIEVGFPEITLTTEGKSDPVFSKFKAPNLLCHGDTWDLPPNGTLLAISNNYRQAFRCGTAVGVQFHPEATLESVRSWLDGMKKSTSADRIPNGLDFELVWKQANENVSKTRESAFALFDAWVKSWPKL